jgi:hypothetical protein
MGLLSNFSRYVSYRLRLVSISCDPSFIFSIDNHNLTVIEVEGINVQPLEVDSLEIFAGTCVDYFYFLVVLIDWQNRSTLLRCCMYFFFLHFIGSFILTGCSSPPISLLITTVSFSSL